MTNVMNLCTGKISTFDLPPDQAVVAAFEQYNRNCIPIDYRFKIAKKSKSGLLWCCGDFCAYTLESGKTLPDY